jgi:hypothetical protein
MVGIGLMSAGADNDKLPDDLGLFIMCGGLLFAVGSWVMHIQRMNSFSKGSRCQIWSSFCSPWFPAACRLRESDSS